MSLKYAPKNISGFQPEVFLGCDFDPNTPALESPDLQLLSGGQTHAVYPWYFDLNEMDCYLLLYTKKGQGKLSLREQIFLLEPGTILFLDCREHFRIDLSVSPWDYSILFFRGRKADYYKQLIAYTEPVLLSVSPYCEVAMSFDRIYQYTGTQTCSQLLANDCLSHLLAILSVSLLEANSSQSVIPSYIEEIHTLLEDHFHDFHSLDLLENRFNISKYRICREFRFYYEETPLQFLNKRRIQMAKYYLETTDCRIHEIGSMVGIDNTNHFIHLFKRFTGCTPAEYKKR